MKRILAERSVLGAFGATVAALGLLVGWTKELRPGWLLGAGAALAAGVLLLVWSRHRLPGLRVVQLTAAQVLVATGLATAGAFSWQFSRVEAHWPALLERRQASAAAALEGRLADVVRRGGTAAAEAARLGVPPDRNAFGVLASVRERLNVDALALFTEAGALVAWAGEHRGPLPKRLAERRGEPHYEERPLFSYLYFQEPVEGRPEYVVAAVLVETGFASDAGQATFSDVFAPDVNLRANFRSGPGPDAVWALTSGADTLVHARLDALTQSEWRSNLNRLARRLVLLSVVSGFVLASLAWLGWTRPVHSRLAATLPLLLTAPLIAGSPLRGMLGGERIFSPGLFSLAVPSGDVTLGRMLAVLAVIGALAAGLRRPPLRPSLGLAWTVGGALAVAASYPVLIELLFQGATSSLLQGGAPYWLGMQFAATLALACVTGLAMPRSGPGGDNGTGWIRWRSRRVRQVLAAAGIVLSSALALAVAQPAMPGEPLPFGMAALWGIPFLALALATAGAGGRSGALTRWLAAGWLAGTAVVPQLWSAHMQARLASAEGELRTLGTSTDSFLDYLLVAFGREALARFDAGEENVLLLYRTWVASGLAQEPYPVWILLWSAEGLPELQLGSAPPPSESEMRRLLEIVQDAREHPVQTVLPFTDLSSASRIMVVPLADGSTITVMVPPRRSLEPASSIAPFLGEMAAQPRRMHLVEVGAQEPRERRIEWTSHPSGWRTATLVQYPEGWYHAHLVVPVPSPGVRYARASLLLTFDLALLTFIWVMGVVGRGGTAVPRGDWTGWLRSFRARVTVALFAFFLMPTALFGWVAYTALAGEVARAAQTVARHSVAQAVVEFEDVGGDLRELAAHAGSDVLRFVGGELIAVSSREALDLGVYSAWMPPDVHRQLESGEELTAAHVQTLAGHSFVTAYQSLQAAGALGVPVSLTSGEAAARQREFAHLVLFAAVVGALLSLALSVAVGRALAGPIGRLSRAATAVGAGRLGVRLPAGSGDEFGDLFAAFNRMTRRLRRARAREIRTARVLAWGEMARQVAHEIKNPLTPIKLSVQHLRRAHGDRHPQFDEILDTNVTQILSEIDRLSDIARAFSRYGAPAEAAGPLAVVDAAAVIRESLTLYRSGDRDIRYIDAVPADLPRVRARVDELKEVLLNLVENSRAALDGSGEIVFEGSHVGDRVEITVRDTGPGIPPDLLPRVFEPHFSTRSAGTGLGLAIVRRLVESWGGTVTAESNLGQGTVVRIRFVAV